MKFDFRASFAAATTAPVVFEFVSKLGPLPEFTPAELEVGTLYLRLVLVEFLRLRL